MEKFLCNYCYVAECLDQFPKKISETKCSGLTEEESNNGGCCEYFSNKILNKKDANYTEGEKDGKTK